MKTNDITGRVESIKLGSFISSGLHQSRWDKKLVESTDTAQSKRVTHLENNINTEAGKIGNIEQDVNNVHNDINGINNNINDINAAIQDIYSKLPQQNP